MVLAGSHAVPGLGVVPLNSRVIVCESADRDSVAHKLRDLMLGELAAH